MLIPGRCASTAHLTGCSARTPRSAEFDRNRPVVLRRDRFTCQLQYADVCTGRATEVDHIRNVKDGGGDHMANLQSVCSDCHKVKTGIEGRKAWAKVRREAQHPDARLKHPGLA